MLKGERGRREREREKGGGGGEEARGRWWEERSDDPLQVRASWRRREEGREEASSTI